MKTALVIQHHRHETLGDNFRRVLVESGYEIATLDLFEGAPEFDSFDAPDLGGVDLIIALGGPMSANDGLPALEAEMAYLKHAAESGTPVLGICLGSATPGPRAWRRRAADGRLPVRTQKAMDIRGRPRRPRILQHRHTARSHAARRELLHPARRDRTRRRLHPPQGRQIPPHQHGIPLQQRLRSPIRAAANPERIKGVEPRTSLRLQPDGPRVRPIRGSPPKPARVPDIRPPPRNADVSVPPRHDCPAMNVQHPIRHPRRLAYSGVYGIFPPARPAVRLQTTRRAFAS